MRASIVIVWSFICLSINSSAGNTQSNYLKFSINVADFCWVTFNFIKIKVLKDINKSFLHLLKPMKRN